MRVQEPRQLYEIHSTTPSAPMLKHYLIADIRNYASVAAGESSDLQDQLTKTRWIFFTVGQLKKKKYNV